jgi:hypothetical protein
MRPLTGSWRRNALAALAYHLHAKEFDCHHLPGRFNWFAAEPSADEMGGTTATTQD